MEIDVSRQRYSESQILFGLREAWQEFTGVNDPFDAETLIYTFMKSDGSWDELDFADIFYGIERFFGFQCSDKEWTDFFGFNAPQRGLEEWKQTVAPNLTFGSLARFIAERAPVIASFDPISVFGRLCGPAGVFEGIEVVANKTMGRALRFPPSARIIDVMRGHDLDRFWTQLRWMTEHAAPELPSFWRNVTAATDCFAVLAVIAAAIGSWATSNPAWVAQTLLVAVVSYLFASAYKRFTNPLPSNIVTFRDLSMLIAARGSLTSLQWKPPAGSTDER